MEQGGSQADYSQVDPRRGLTASLFASLSLGGRGGWASSDPAARNRLMGFVSVPFAGIRDGPHLCLSASPAELEPEAGPEAEPESLEPFLGVATWEAWPEREELLQHVRRGALSWDESVLETMSPKLTMGTGSGGGEGQRRGGGGRRPFQSRKGGFPVSCGGRAGCCLGRNRAECPAQAGGDPRLPAWTSHPPESLLCLPSHAVMARGKQAPAEFAFYLFT